MKQYLDAIKKYVQFSGRSSRKEFWMFFLFNFIFSFILANLTRYRLYGSEYYVVSPLYLFYCLFMFLPGLAVLSRRLHDIGKSGWWSLVAIVPFLNLYLLYLLIKPSQSGVNAYGVPSDYDPNAQVFQDEINKI